uniref:Protein phosphatase methylesterase-1 n=1 Tax=Macrostomum lignano TaxID=282301 RepID=A0A1I8JNH6_9PLAT
AKVAALPNRRHCYHKSPSATSQHGVNPQCFDPFANGKRILISAILLELNELIAPAHFATTLKRLNQRDAANAAHNDTASLCGGISAPPVQSPPLVFLLHGGGFSGLSWAAMSASLVGKVVCRCVSFDIRGSSATVVMGGAIATHLAYSGLCPLPVCRISCYRTLWKASAMEALSHMRGYLASRPSRFPSLQAAISVVLSLVRTVHNLDSARVSFPGHLKLVFNPSERQQQKQKDQEEPKQPRHSIRNQKKKMRNKQTLQIPCNQNSYLCLAFHSRGPALLNSRSNKPPMPMAAATAADNRPSYRSVTQQVDPTQPYYTWRIDLSSTESHFGQAGSHGMSRKFLEVPAQRCYCWRCLTRLDRELTVGQMQGKFQMQLLHRSGHAVHEDLIRNTLRRLLRYRRRFSPRATTPLMDLRDAVQWVHANAAQFGGDPPASPLMGHGYVQLWCRCLWHPSCP